MTIITKVALKLKKLIVVAAIDKLLAITIAILVFLSQFFRVVGNIFLGATNQGFHVKRLTSNV